MTGTTPSPGWPADPTAAPPVETLDEEPVGLEPEIDEQPKKRGRPKKDE